MATQHAGKEIVTRPMSEYFANDPECHDLLACALRSHRVAGLGGCSTGPPVGGVTSTSTPALWPYAVLWPCTFCSDRPTHQRPVYQLHIIRRGTIITGAH